jgi:ribosome-associated translation inhibitor RaiA
MIRLNCGKDGKNLTQDEKDLVILISEEFFEKLKRYSKKIDLFDVHLKCHKKEGNVKRYILGIRVVLDGNDFDTDVEDYDLKEGIRKAIKKIQNEVEHRLHISDQKKSKI